MKILFIIIVTLIPTSFVNGQYKITSEVIGKVKSIKQITYLAEDVWGETKIIRPEKDDDETDEVENNYYLRNFNKGHGNELINYNSNGSEYSKQIKNINKNVIEIINFVSDTAQNHFLSSKIIYIYTNRKHNTLLQSKNYDSRDSLIYEANYDKKGRILNSSSNRTYSYLKRKKEKKLEKNEFSDGELFIKTIYNRKGDIIETNYFGKKVNYSNDFPSPLLYKSISTYDKKGNLIESNIYRDDSIKYEQHIYIYNKHCKLIESKSTYFKRGSTKTYDKSGCLITETKNHEIFIKKYDSKRNLVEEKIFDNTIVVHSNDSIFNLTDIDSCVSRGQNFFVGNCINNKDNMKISGIYFYKYDNNNNIIQRKEYDYQGDINCTTFEYEYDKKGNWVVRKKIENGFYDDFYLTIRNIEY